MSANLGTNICPRGKQALPGSAINRIIKQTVMSGIIANYDKICFGICLRGSRVLKSAQEFITAAGLNRHLSKHSVCVCVCACGRGARCAHTARGGVCGRGGVGRVGVNSGEIIEAAQQSRRRNRKVNSASVWACQLIPAGEPGYSDGDGRRRSRPPTRKSERLVNWRGQGGSRRSRFARLNESTP